MAKSITLQFTDKQWELIQEHYPVYDEQRLPISFTEEVFINLVQEDIGSKVTNILGNKAAEASQNAFNV